jgi:hypothetical protein
VKRILKELQLETPDLNVEEIDFASPIGSRLAIENNVTYPPAIFLDDELIAKGKIYSEQIVAAIQTARGVKD